MGHGSAFLIFLLAIFACAFVVEGADRCNFNASIPCFTRMQFDKITIDKIFNFFKRSDLNTGCSYMNNISSCVKSKTKDCDPDEKNPLKKIWTKVEDSVHHVCEKNREAFSRKRECLARPEVSSAALDCQNKHTIRRRYARHTCSDYQEAVKCVNKAIFDHCDDESKKLMDHLVRNTLSLLDIDHDCEQNSSGRSTEDSIVFSFIMCTASFLLALLLN